MLNSYAKSPKWIFAAITTMSLVVLVAFQNCGKAGFDDGSSTAVDDIASLTAGDTKYAAAPFPFDANLNVISYMTCPGAGKESKIQSEDLAKAFYHIRAGAYDFEPYAKIFAPAGLTPTEQSRRLKAGIGIKQEFFDFLTNMKRNKTTNNSTEVDKDQLRQALMSSPKTKNLRLAMGLIFEDRSRVEGGFGWDYSLYSPLLEDLNGSVMANYLSGAHRLEGVGTSRLSFFSSLDPAHRALVGSLSWGEHEADRETLNSQLRSSLILTLGYMPEGGHDITMLKSPDNDQYKTVYGRGYRMSFTNRSEILETTKSHLLNDIEEMNMATKPLQSIRGQEGQAWNCFSLAIVRDIDRIDPMTNRPYTNQRFHDAVSSTGTRIPGVRRACPVQTIENLNASITESNVTYEKNQLRLEMARRVLPADLWEINTDPNFLCAVPTEKALLQASSCYASGDHDNSKYIQYLLGPYEAGKPNLDCGANGKNECPAFVSICYRSK